MHQVSWTRQLGLAIALIVLGGFAYWSEYKHKPAVEAQKEASRRFFEIKGKQVESIQLWDGKDHFTFHCLDMTNQLCKPGDNSKWEITEPMKVKADDSNVNALLSSLNNLDKAETIDLKDETPEKRATIFKEYGLSPEDLQSPGHKQVATQTSKETTFLYFGNFNPVGENYYAAEEVVPKGQKPTGKIDQTQAFVAPSYFKSNFDKNLTFWRDKRLLGFAPADVQSFELKSKKAGDLTLVHGKGQWEIQSRSGNIPGDIENVDAFLSALSFMTAKDFAANDKNGPEAKAVLKGARVLLTLTLHDPKEVMMTVYEKGGVPEKKKPKKGAPTPPPTPPSTLYAVVSGADPLYELNSMAREQLDKSIKDFQLNKLITSTERFTIKQMEFSGPLIGNPPLTLKQVNSVWKIEPGDQIAAQNKVQDTLDKLSGNRIQEILTGSAIPEGQKSGMTVSLGDEKNPAKRQFLFWRQNGKVYARDLQANRDQAFAVDTAVADGLPWQRGYYNQSTPSPSPAPSAGIGTPGVNHAPPPFPGGTPPGNGHR